MNRTLLTRVAITALLLTCVLAGCERAPEYPTQLIEVDGNPTRTLTLGLQDREAGQAAIVLFAGAGAPIESWGDWISSIAPLAPVVTFDRPGVGGSPFNGVVPAPQRMAQHARSVLDALGVGPPYLLVGHSWGGPLIRFFAGQYPEDTVGLVYLDPTDMTATDAESAGASSDEELAAIHAEVDSIFAARDIPEGRRAERDAITAFLRAPLLDRQLPEDLDVPTAVVLALQVPEIPETAPSYVTRGWYEAMFARRAQQFGAWADADPQITLRVASHAGHFIHLDDSAVATEAVQDVLVRSSASSR